MRVEAPGERSRPAIWAGRLGVASVLLFPAPFAIAAGLWTLLELRRHPASRGRGSAITGLLLGALGCVAMALLNRDLLAPSAFLALCIGFVAAAVGWVHGCVVAADERPVWGALSALFPIVLLWYCSSRWRRCWPDLFLMILGYPLLMWALAQLMMRRGWGS